MRTLYKSNELNLQRLLKNRYSKNHQKKEVFYWYLISLIRFKTFYGLADDYGYVHISTKDLNEIFLNAWISRINEKGEVEKGKTEHLLTVVRRDLEEWGVIKYYNRFNEDKGRIDQVRYKLDYKYLYDYTPLDLSQFESKYYTKMLSDEFDPSILVGNGICHQLYMSMIKFELDKEQAKKWVHEAYINDLELKPKFKDNQKIERKMDSRRYQRYLYHIENFGDHWLYPSGNGRITTNLNTLPSELREFLYVNDLPTVEIDISNSQPLMIGLLMKANYELIGDKSYEYFGELESLKPPQDFEQYMVLVQNGEFYDFLKSEFKRMGIKYDDDMFKMQFFTRVLFDDESRNYKFKKGFRELFPSVARFIVHAKDFHGNDGFSILLQQKEGQIVNRISKRLIQFGIDHFSIHDGFRVEDRFNVTEKVQEIILDEFQLEGVVPSVKLS